MRHDNIEAIYKKLEERRRHGRRDGILLKELHRYCQRGHAHRRTRARIRWTRNMFDMLGAIDLEKLRVEFKEKKVKRKAYRAGGHLREVVGGKKLERMLAQNPLRMDYYKKYSEIIADYDRDKDRVTIEEEPVTKLVEICEGTRPAGKTLI